MTEKISVKRRVPASRNCMNSLAWGPGCGRIQLRAAFAAAAAFAMIVRPADAQPRRIQVGTLTCSLSAGVGLVVGSQRNVNCLLKGQPGEPEETYTGTMTELVSTSALLLVARLSGQCLRIRTTTPGCSPGLTPGRQRKYPSPPVSALMSLSADRTGRWRCSPCRCRGKSASISLPG